MIKSSNADSDGKVLKTELKLFVFSGDKDTRGGNTYLN